jgi:hypothetical protein
MVARRIGLHAAAALGLGAVLVLPASAHEIPASVTVHAYVKPEGKQLRVLLRVPMRAMRDVEFPRRSEGFLDLARAEPALRDAVSLWILHDLNLYEGDADLAEPRIAALRVAFESDRSFASYEQALAGVTGPRLPDDTLLPWNQGMLDALLEYPIRSDRSEFSIRPAFARLGVRVVTALSFLPPSAAPRAFELEGDPGLVRLDPRWHQAAARFVQAGFFHILQGTDHLLFLFCLVIPFRRLRALIAIATSFTVAHSITLIAAACNLAPDGLWFPPLIETLIALSIVYLALENIVGSNLGRRWAIAFAFGLVHGFGFSFALRQTLQFAGSHVAASLAAFNVGVEIGQVAVLVALVPALEALFRFAVAERIGTIILSAIVAHTGWHWMTERAERLRQFPWPAFDAALALTAVRWVIAIVVLGGLVWIVSVLTRQKPARSAENKSTVGTHQ